MSFKGAFAFLMGIILFFSAAYLFLRYADFDTDETIVAVLDTGVNYEHDFLKGKVINGLDFSSRDKDSMDSEGHGTHVAGIIAGIAPKAKILAVRLIDEEKPVFFNSDLPILYSIIKGADVINMSFSGEYHKSTQWIINLGLKKGVTFIASSGNSSLDEVDYPARYDGVIAVAAFDNKRKSMYEDSNLGENVDFLAPGVNIESSALGSENAVKTGTSMAAAHVSGIVAKMKSEADYRPSEVLTALRGMSLDFKGDVAYKALDSDYLSAIDKGRVFVWQQGQKQKNGKAIDLNLKTINSRSVDIYVNDELHKRIEGDIDENVTLQFGEGVHEIKSVATPVETLGDSRGSKVQLKGKVQKSSDSSERLDTVAVEPVVSVQQVVVDTEVPIIKVKREWSDRNLLMVLEVNDFTLKEVNVTLQKKTVSYEKNALGNERIYVPIRPTDFPVQIEAVDYNGNKTNVTYEDIRHFQVESEK